MGLNLSGSSFLLWAVLAICVLVISRYCALLYQRQRQVEADYLNLLNTANEGIWTIDAAKRTTYVNQRLTEMLGYTPQEMQGRLIFDFLVDEVSVNIQEYFERSHRGSKAQSISFRGKDGSALSGVVSTSPRLDQRGTFVGTLIMIATQLQTEVALQQVQEERQYLQSQLEQQAQTMDTVLSASPDHFYMFDREGRFLYASHAGLQALGLQKSDIIGKTEHDLGFPPEVVEPHQRRREIAFATGEHLRGETSTQTVDGVRHYEYIFTPIQDASGSVQVVVVTARDITERKQAEEELRQYRHHLEELVAGRTAELLRTIEQLNQEIIERKRVEVALRDREQQLLAIARHLPGAFYRVVLHLDGTITLPFVSEGWWEISNLSPVEAITHPSALSESIHPDDRAKFDELVRVASETEQPFQYEFRILTKSGKVKWVQSVAHIHHQENGDLVVDTITLDITERKLAEEKLQRSEAHLAEAQKIAHIGSWEYDAVTGSITFSDEVFRILGLDPGQPAPTYEEHLQQIHPDDRELWQNTVQAAIAHGIPYQFDFRHLRPDGSIRWVNAIGQVDLNSQGQVIRLFGTTLDITERKQIEQDLQRQARYQQLLAEITLRMRESLQIEVILQTTVTELQQLLGADRVLFYRLFPDCNGKVLAESVVPGWQSLLGRELLDQCFEGEYLQQYQQEIHAWSDVEQAGFQPCHLEILRQFDVRADLIVPILLKDQIWGMLFVHQCSAPRQWNQFEIDLLRQLANQVSIALAQAQLLEQATGYSQDLARSNAELEQFAYVASHDLQEPLRTLASYAKLLSRRYSSQLDEKGNRFIQYILEEALRLQALINDLLEYSRVGRQAPKLAACDINAVFDIVVRRLEGAIANSGATVTCGELPTIMADERQMVQLLQNLISNAIKYRSSKPPVVEVGVQPQQREWLFWVRDNGIGIDARYAQRIFAIFQRLHTQEEYSGTGIGLAIAAKIAEHHGGRIWVESEPGQGATFYFTIRQF